MFFFLLALPSPHGKEPREGAGPCENNNNNSAKRDKNLASRSTEGGTSVQASGIEPSTYRVQGRRLVHLAYYCGQITASTVISA